MLAVYALFSTLLIVLQISFYGLSKVNGESKYWNLFFGLNISSILSTLMNFIILASREDTDLGAAIAIMIISGLSIIINIILLIISLCNKRNHKFMLTSVVVGIVVLLISFLTFFLIPKTNENIRQKLVQNKIISFLNKKYGDNDFEIVSIKKDYSYNGIVQKYFSGYDATISSSSIKDEFNLSTNSTNIYDFEHEYDDFLDNYYNEKLNGYLLEKYKLKMEIWIDEKDIPIDLGHIPEFDELTTYKAVNSIYVKGDFDDKEDEGGIIFSKELTIDLIKHLNIKKEIKMEYDLSDKKNNEYYYIIEYIDGVIKITDHDDKSKIYNFDINGNKMEKSN